MKRTLRILTCVAFGLLAVAEDASAQGNSGKGGPGGQSCDNVLIRLGQTRSIVYDPVDEAPRMIEVELSNDSPGQSLDCNLQSVVLSQTTPQPLAFVGEGGGVLRTEQVRDPMYAYKQQNFVLSNSALRALERGDVLRFGLVEAETGQFITPGRYVLPFSVEVNGAVASSAELAVDVIANVFVSVFGKSSRVTTLDFGELETGETQQSVVLVKTNARLRVAAHSDNGGQLKLETMPDAPGVPYIAYLDGEMLELSSGSAHEVAAGQGAGDPQVMKLLVQIGEVAVPLAGTYTDILTLDFSGY